MCHNIEPLLASELEAALDSLATIGRARVPARDANTEVPNAYPGKSVALFVPGDAGNLSVATLTWGFSATIGNSSKLVFNTRLETALAHARSGRGLWAEPILRGRCLVPVRGFYESWTKSPDQRRAEVRFRMPGHRVFLLAGVWQDERFSIMTTEPNAVVGTYHTRMPLVLAPGESGVWLGPDFATLADRSAISLDALPVRTE